MSNNPRHNHNSSRQRGFTLIELLVSATVFAMLLGILGSGLNVLARGWDKNIARIDNADMLSRTSFILRRDGRGLQRLTNQTDLDPKYIFVGKPHQLSFIVAEPPYPTLPGLYFVNYSVVSNKQETRLVRSRAVYNPELIVFPGATPANQVPVLQGPYQYRFSYGVNVNGQRKWFDSWPHETRLPELVRLRVIDLNRNEQLSPPIIFSISADAELACMAKAAQLCSPKSNGELRALKKDENENKENNQNKGNDGKKRIMGDSKT